MDAKTDQPSVVIVSQHFPPDKSGNASRVNDTAKHLTSEGWDVTVLAPPPAFPHGQFKRSWERNRVRESNGITIHNLWAWQPTIEDPDFISRIAYYLIFPLHALLWLLSNYRDYDIIMTSSPPIFTGLAALPFRLFGQKPWIVDVRDLWIDASIGLGFLQEGGVLERVSRRYQRFVLKTADQVTVTTTMLGSRLVEEYDITNGKITHLPNGVDTSVFKPTESNQEPTIVYTGNVGHAQDLKSCILAMKQINHSNAILKIVGDGDIRAELEQIVDRENLNEYVEFTGLVQREAIPRILNESMVGLAPLKDDETLEYAVPTKVYEYMACELPVVATGVGEIEALIEESNGGIFMENDPDALSKAFDALLENPTKRNTLGKSGRRHMIEHYDRSVVARQLSNILRESL